MRITQLLIVITTLAVGSLLAGCNTVKGVGKDIHDGAQNVQQALEGSDRNSDYIPPG